MSEIDPAFIPELVARKEAGETWDAIAADTGISKQVLRFYVQPLVNNPGKPSDGELTKHTKRALYRGHHRRAQF